MSTDSPISNYVGQLESEFSDDPELNLRFGYHPPTPDAITAHQLIRAESRRLAYILKEHVPEGRELALALTKLEEMVFHANSGIARQPARDKLKPQEAGNDPGSFEDSEKPNFCPHAAPHVYCSTCVVQPCPLGLSKHPE